MNLQLYHLTGISRGRATVTYAGQPIGAIYQRPGTDLWRAEMMFGTARSRIPGLYAGRRSAKLAVIERHMTAQERRVRAR